MAKHWCNRCRKQVDTEAKNMPYIYNMGDYNLNLIRKCEICPGCGMILSFNILKGDNDGDVERLAKDFQESTGISLDGPLERKE
jgi:hypothetical protein